MPRITIITRRRLKPARREPQVQRARLELPEQLARPEPPERLVIPARLVRLGRRLPLLRSQLRLLNRNVSLQQSEIAKGGPQMRPPFVFLLESDRVADSVSTPSRCRALIDQGK